MNCEVPELYDLSGRSDDTLYDQQNVVPDSSLEPVCEFVLYASHLRDIILLLEP